MIVPTASAVQSRLTASFMLGPHFGGRKFWPDISAPLAATLTGEARLDVRQPNVLRPSVAADRGPMAAPEIGAIDEETANAGGAHLFKVIFFWRVRAGIAPSKRVTSRFATRVLSQFIT
jgi:hypothetical protein